MTYTVLPIEMPNYEKRLDANRTWALREGGMFFQNESEVQKLLSRITGRLHDLSIDYAVVGGMALFTPRLPAVYGGRRYIGDAGWAGESARGAGRQRLPFSVSKQQKFARHGKWGPNLFASRGKQARDG